jgi:MFS family permease
MLVAGGLVMQFPMGWMSDRFDRRNILLGLTLAASVAASLIIAFGATSLPILILLVFVYGCLAGPLYGLSVAQTNDYVERDQFVAASSGLLIVYAIGAIAGPNVASWIMSLVGPWGLWLYAAVSMIGLAAFTVYRKARRAPLPVDEQTAYVPAAVAEKTPVAVELDPRAAATPTGQETRHDGA